MEDDELDVLRDQPVPLPRKEARQQALVAAMTAFDLANSSTAPQGSRGRARLIGRATALWRVTMHRKMLATPAIAGLLALPFAGYTAYYLVQERSFRPVSEVGRPAREEGAEQQRKKMDARLDDGEV